MCGFGTSAPSTQNKHDNSYATEKNSKKLFDTNDVKLLPIHQQ